MRAPLAAPARDHWEPVNCAAIAPARDDTRLHRCDVLADHLVLTVRRGGEQLLVITDHDGGDVREVRASVAAGWIRVEHAEEYDRGSVIIGEESLIEPLAWYELDLDTGRAEAAQADGGSRVTIRPGTGPSAAPRRRPTARRSR